MVDASTRWGSAATTTEWRLCRSDSRGKKPSILSHTERAGDIVTGPFCARKMPESAETAAHRYSFGSDSTIQSPWGEFHERSESSDARQMANRARHWSRRVLPLYAGHGSIAPSTMAIVSATLRLRRSIRLCRIPSQWSLSARSTSRSRTRRSPGVWSRAVDRSVLSRPRPI